VLESELNMVGSRGKSRSSRRVGGHLGKVQLSILFGGFGDCGELQLVLDLVAVEYVLFLL